MTTRYRPASPGRLTGSLLMAGLIGLASCTSVHTETNPNDSIQKKVHWSFKRQAVTLDVFADLDLNLADKRPHTLVVGIMEFQDPNAFLALVQDPDRAMETLAAGKKRTGILGMWRFIVPPGAHQLLTVDRMRHGTRLPER